MDTRDIRGGHKTVALALAEAIRRRILEGRYPTGMKLNQVRLAKELGASRIPLREALLQLDAEGLVEISPQRGATVTKLSRERMSETMELRALLEPHLLRLSAPRLTQADLAAIERLLDDYGAAMSAMSVSRWGELNTAFHLALYARAERPRSLAMVATLLRESDRYTRVQLSASPAHQARAQAEHVELLRLVRAGNFDNAAALTRDHIQRVESILSGMLTG